ncbi:MAG: Hpt domain-containing protein [Candidatus Electrothrix sp. YB6]
MRNPVSDIVDSFLEEVEGYLPDMRRCLQSLQQNRQHRQALAEFHRIAHTIKGAAAMVGLDDLSGIGELLEKVMENVLASALSLDDELLTLLEEATGHIERYCMAQREGDTDPGLLPQEIEEEFRKKLGDLPSEPDENILEIVLAAGREGAEQSFLFEETEEAGHSDTETEDLFFPDEEGLPVAADDDLFLSDEITEETTEETTEDTPEAGNDYAGEDTGASAVDPELLQCFAEETDEELGNIDRFLHTLADAVSASSDGKIALSGSNQENLHSVRRSVHTLKGAAAVIGIDPVAAWGHDFEDFLDWLHDEAQAVDAETVAAVQEGADLLAKLAEEPTCPVAEEKQRLTAWFARLTAAGSDRAGAGGESGSAAEADPVADLFGGAGESLISDDADGGLFGDVSDDSSGDAADELLFPSDDSLDDRTGAPEDTAAEEAIDPELLECFHEEAEEHLEDIDKQLKELSAVVSGPVEISDSLRSMLHLLRRSVHTLKGAAAVIGIDSIAAWGREVEDFLDWLHDEAGSLEPETLVLVRQGTDLLVRLTGNPACSIEQEKAALAARFGEITAAAGDTASGRDNASAFEEDEADGADEEEAPEDETGHRGAGTDKELSALFGDEEELTDDTGDSFFDELSSADTDSDSDDLFSPAARDIPETLPQEPVAQAQDTGATGVDAVDPELLECFHEEAEEHLQNIDRQLNHLGMTVSGQVRLSDRRRAPLHSVRRSVHTVKGASAVIGIDRIAAWGHEFEDFLDWLHDDARFISPETVSAMLDGGDILARLVEDPSYPAAEEQEAARAQFREVIAADTGESGPHGADEPAGPIREAAPENILKDVAVQNEKVRQGQEDAAEVETGSAAEEEAPAGQPAESTESPSPAAPAQQKSSRKIATLRVDVDKVDQMVGLSGDMVINLSSFEGSMSAMSGTMKELDMILQRLKNINSSLEAGYELASIPHLRGAAEADSTDITEDFDPLEMDRYSELNILIRSLSEAVSDLDSMMAQNVLDNITWQETVERQTLVLKELQNRMVNIRMTPLSTLSARMYRTVREAARTTGHPARLNIEGESIMMDTRVWDVMADPMMHILRNSVAHGGRPIQETEGPPLSVQIRALRRGGQFTLEISDNGRGLNYDAIRQKGRKLYPGERIDLMSRRELAALIFRHGFSSAGAVTSVAGRGVGMDVVRDAVEQLNGSIEISSEPGQGMELIIRLPVAVAQLAVILVYFGTQLYAIPMHDVQSIVRCSPEEMNSGDYDFDGKIIPLLRPAEVPGFATWSQTDSGQLSAHDQALLIVRVGREQAAVQCDQLVGQRDIVFKDLGVHLRSSVPCIAGMTVMGDGTLIPILQTEEFLRRGGAATIREEHGTAVPEHTEHAEEEQLRILVVDDSISVRKVVSNVITQQGWLAVAARNGIEAVEKIREERPHFVLLDVEMPRMNGFEVLQALQAQPELRDIPVTMLTSRSAEKYREKARQLGARGFLTKPFKSEEVVSLIRSMTSD